MCIDCFSRQVWARAPKHKTQEEVKIKLSQIISEVGSARKPKIVSSNDGQEFQGLVPEFLTRKGIAQRSKSIGDVNALGLVD